MLRRCVPFFAYAFTTLVGLTNRTVVVNSDIRDRLWSSGQRFIYSFWHQRQVFFTWSHRGAKAAVLVSRSFDGELIAEAMRLSRIKAVRGSSSRGGVAAAREMVAILRSGWDVGITPDGPRGPARQVKDGVLRVAQLSGSPILPIANATSRRLVLKRSWDQFHVPLPFGRAAVVYGEPIYVGANDILEKKALELKEAMDRATLEADRLVA